MSGSDDIIEGVISAIRARIGSDCGINASWKYELGADSYIHVDCNTTPHQITRENKPADCAIAVTLDDLNRMLAGEMDSTTAFTQGKLRLSGDMSIVMRIDMTLGTSRAAQG